MRTDIGSNRTDVWTSSTPESLALDGKIVFCLNFVGETCPQVAEERRGESTLFRTVGLDGVL
jgi:hypothetical protein